MRDSNTFQRSPRLLPELPGGEAVVPPVPQEPPAPTVTLLSVLVPAFGSLVSLALMFYSNSRGGNPWLIVGYAVPGLLTVVLYLYNYQQQRQQYRQALAARREKYLGALHDLRYRLEALRTTQQQALEHSDPEPAACLARVLERAVTLWERSPTDSDFLTVRVGVGRAPFRVRLKFHGQGHELDADPLQAAAEQLVADFAWVDRAPVCVPLARSGVTGLAGERAQTLSLVRALLLQVAAHHSPDEVKIVCLFPPEERTEWAWLRWLPHVWSENGAMRYLACEREQAQRLMADLSEALGQRRPTCHFLFILAAPSLAAGTALLPRLLTDGQSLGTSALLMAARREDLPKEAQAIIETGRLILTAPTQSVLPFAPDTVTSEMADRFARAMAPLKLRRLASASEVPRSVPLLSLLGANRVQDLQVARRWQESGRQKSLAAPLGIRAGGEPLLFDLSDRRHGPHGLVAGATGSGKSELLQSLLCSLAVNYHPHEVTFVLVDFKGGSMANLFRELPHLVGTITNLDGNLAARAMAALRGELRRRQTLLSEVGVNHIDDYPAGRQPLPHLLLVVDEFAELKADQPQFMRELISAVRVGRSLGVHLILATQKPAGVVDDQIWSNSRFRLCLRVERPEDSNEVLKRPEAASITEVGRAYLQVGNNEVFELFQAAWGGAAYFPEGAVARDPREIAEVELGGARRPINPTAWPALEASQTQLQALVAHLKDVARELGIQALPGPWLEPLPDQVALPALDLPPGWNGQTWAAHADWLRPVVGLFDDPANQRQGALRINLAREGHLALYGAPGTGKTTLLQTLITSLARAHPPSDLHIYVMDFGGRALSLFADLPHVGAVILADEAERVHRLMRLLQEEVDRRKAAFARAGVNTLGAYRTTGIGAMPALILALDNYTAFAAACPEAEEQLAQIAREGGSLGIHVVITAGGPSMVRMRLSSSITMAAALTLADRGEYGLVVGRTDGLEPADIPGRALIKGEPPLEFQVALPAEGSTEFGRTAALKALVQRMAQAWTGPRPLQVGVMPEVVALSDLSSEPRVGAVPVGLAFDRLEPLTVDLQDGPHFVITGPVQSGKSTLLQAWLAGLAQCPSVHIYTAGPSGTIQDDAALEEALEAISLTLHQRREKPATSQVLAIDDLDWLRAAISDETAARLEHLVRRERGKGFHLLLVASAGSFDSSWDGYVKALKEIQCGFLLGSAEHSDAGLLGLRLPAGEAGGWLPPGVGFYCRRGRYRKFKSATAELSARGR